jgi:hypothetical protein
MSEIGEGKRWIIIIWIWVWTRVDLSIPSPVAGLRARHPSAWPPDAQGHDRGRAGELHSQPRRWALPWGAWSVARRGRRRLCVRVLSLGPRPVTPARELCYWGRSIWMFRGHRWMGKSLLHPVATHHPQLMKMDVFLPPELSSCNASPPTYENGCVFTPWTF